MSNRREKIPPHFVVWVVDDDLNARELAAECIMRVADSMKLAVEIREITNLTWPPEYGKGPKNPKEGELPHLVVLDLLQQGVLVGNNFYNGLRNEEENGQARRAKAFVIMWSVFLSRDNKARAFAATEARTDDRAINLKVGYQTPKAADVLAEAVRGAFGRMLAEDIWAIEAEGLRIPWVD